MLLKIEDMSCGRCARTIAKSIAAVDPQARIEVDVARRLMHVRTDVAPQQIVEAAARAGYHATPTADDAAPVQRSGCCCAAKSAGVDASQPASATRGSCCG